VDELLELEETKLKQRAKINWLKHGDQNSKFYHACINQRRRNNYISHITDSMGIEVFKHDGIEGAFIDYFKNIFTSQGQVDLAECLEGLPKKVTNLMNEKLLREPTMEEFDVAISQMDPLKSPGPNGFPVGFYQDNWHSVGPSLFNAALDFFKYGDFDSAMNYTHICLIPKKNHASCVTDFRPISLCNVVYKIILKALANRLKSILPSIISKNQSTFIPGRLILDNILAAYETLHTMHAQMWGKVGYMAIKLDMSKAYNRVEWGFLEAGMIKMFCRGMG
jgi:hypothetical protein